MPISSSVLWSIWKAAVVLPFVVRPRASAPLPELMALPAPDPVAVLDLEDVQAPADLFVPMGPGERRQFADGRWRQMTERGQVRYCKAPARVSSDDADQGVSDDETAAETVAAFVAYLRDEDYVGTYTPDRCFEAFTDWLEWSGSDVAVSREQFFPLLHHTPGATTRFVLPPNRLVASVLAAFGDDVGPFTNMEMLARMGCSRGCASTRVTAAVEAGYVVRERGRDNREKAISLVLDRTAAIEIAPADDEVPAKNGSESAQVAA